MPGGRFAGMRRKARVLAIQVLFEVDLAQHPPESCMEAQARYTPQEAVAFARRLVQGVLQHRDEIDEVIERFAPQWPMWQLPVVDRNILRLAIYELLMGKETPPRAAINEAVELAKAFGDEGSPRFVNGVLGSVMEWAAAEEKET